MCAEWPTSVARVTDRLCRTQIRQMAGICDAPAARTGVMLAKMSGVIESSVIGIAAWSMLAVSTGVSLAIIKSERRSRAVGRGRGWAGYAGRRASSTSQTCSTIGARGTTRTAGPAAESRLTNSMTARSAPSASRTTAYSGPPAVTR